MQMRVMEGSGEEKKNGGKARWRGRKGENLGEGSAYIENKKNLGANVMDQCLCTDTWQADVVMHTSQSCWLGMWEVDCMQMPPRWMQGHGLGTFASIGNRKTLSLGAKALGEHLCTAIKNGKFKRIPSLSARVLPWRLYVRRINHTPRVFTQ